MIDYNKLKLNKKGQVTLRSVMDFLLYCSNEERWDAFYEIANGELASEYPMSWKTFWKSLQFAYSDGKAAPSEASELFGECEFDWYDYSTKKEQRFYDEIGAEDYLYRGCTMEELDSDEFGISWTTDKGVAEFFAYRFKEQLEKAGKHPCVVRVPVKYAHICGVLLNRNEKEVILPLGSIDENQAEIDSQEPTEAYEKYMKRKTNIEFNHLK